MDGFYLLVAFSIAMFIGSFLAGLLPLAISLSESRARLLSTFGAGLLVGTALSVILPEGVESLYLGYSGRHAHDIVPKNEQNVLVLQRNAERIHKDDRIRLSYVSHENVSGLQNRRVRQNFEPGLDFQDDVSEHVNERSDIDITVIGRCIGFSLITGFIFMLIVDQVSKMASSRGGERPRYKLTATIGLVVHAAADGVALGSASVTDRLDVQFIIFLAVMLHKAPAAFGLVSFLLVENFERFRIRRHLFVFSIAAPVAAIATFYVLVLVDSGSVSTDVSTGILMLFSAGTFLYVATVHILPELINAKSDYQLVGAVDMGHSHVSSNSPLALKEVLSIIIGAFFPTLLARGHSHHG